MLYLEKGIVRKFKTLIYPHCLEIMRDHNAAKLRLQMDIMETMFTGENIYDCCEQSTSLQKSRLNSCFLHLMLFNLFLIYYMTERFHFHFHFHLIDKSGISWLFFFLDEIMPCPITNKEEYILTKEKNTFRKPHTWHIHPFNIYVVCTKCHAVFCWWKTWANSCTRKVIGVM